MLIRPINFHLPAKMQAVSPHGHAQNMVMQIEKMIWGTKEKSKFSKLNPLSTRSAFSG